MLRNELASQDADRLDTAILRWRAQLPRSHAQSIVDERGVTRIQLPKPMMPPETDDIRTMVEVSLSPSTAAQIAPELTACLSVTKSRSRDGLDLKLMVAKFVDELLEFPADIVQTALKGWAREEVFWPSLAEIRKACVWRVERRRRLLESLIR